MAGDGDIFGGIGQGAASGAATGAMFGPWGAAIGGVAGGIMGYLGKQSQADAMRRQTAEELRRKRLADAQVLGQTTANAYGGGLEADSVSLQSYLTAMQDEMTRQQDWMRRNGSTNASNVSTAGSIGLLTDLGSTFNTLAKSNQYWRGE